MRFDEYATFDATGLAELVRNKEIKPSELLELAIDRTEQVNPKINAVVVQQYDTAREKVSSPQNIPTGPFCGVPFMNKDLGFAESGVPMTNGSRVYKDFVATVDSDLIKRYREAGLVTFGRTNSPEGGLCTTTEPVLHGPTRNPWNLDRTSGGSSGGSAAAVAAGILPVASASDGGGSIRIPASCCGLFGLKPTRNRISAAPHAGDPWTGLAIRHVVSRSVRDSAALLDATHGPMPGDPYAAPAPKRPYLEELESDPAPLRIGFSRQPLYDQPVHRDCIAAMEHAAKLCEDLGHHVEEADMDYNNEAMREGWLTLVAANAAADRRDMTTLFGHAPADEDLEPWSRTMMAHGEALNGADVISATRAIQREGRRIAAYHEKFDLYLTPTLGKPPVPIGNVHMGFGDKETFMERTTSFSPFTRLANVTGQPAMSVPLFWNDENLPIGVSFTAAFGEEGILFQLAGQLERAQSPHKKHLECVQNL